MLSPELVLAILGAIIAACVLILAAVGFLLYRVVQLAFRGRRAMPAARPVAPIAAGGSADPRSAAAIEAFVAELAGEPAAPVRPLAPTPVTALAVVREPVAVMAARPAARAVARARGAARAARPADTPRPAAAADPSAAPMMPWATWSDGPVTVGRQPSEPISAGRLVTRAWSPAGLADAASWERAVREEQARVAHFGRPVTVVMAELPHLEDLARQLGRGVADRVVEETARVLLAQGRAEDRIAWLGHARFGVLLVGSREAGAWDYVGRVRAAVDDWLDAAGLSIRLSLGWAGAWEGGDVMTAAAIAQELLHDDSTSATGRAAAAPVLAGAHGVR